MTVGGDIQSGASMPWREHEWREREWHRHWWRAHHYWQPGYYGGYYAPPRTVGVTISFKNR